MERDFFSALSKGVRIIVGDIANITADKEVFFNISHH